MFSKTTVLLLLLFSYYCSADQLSCRHSVESFDSPLNNRVLIGQVIKSLFTRGGIISCAHRCLSLPLCSSYNYQTSEATDYGRVCELNGGNEDDRQNLVERAGYVFARKRRNTEKTPRSCKEARELTNKRTSGLFCIQDNNGDLYKVYCDLASEHGWAWTLVMSQTLRNKNEPFTQSSFYINKPMNPEAPNWDAYRLPLESMEALRSKSTHWRITCSFDPSSVVNYRDYVRAKFKKFDLLAYDGDTTCEEVEYINVHGHNCENCTAVWYQSNGYFLTHRSAEDLCDFGKAPDSVIDSYYGTSEQNFGRYRGSINHNFSCTTNDLSSTNYWFGSRV